MENFLSEFFFCITHGTAIFSTVRKPVYLAIQEVREPKPLQFQHVKTVVSSMLLVYLEQHRITCNSNFLHF